MKTAWPALAKISSILAVVLVAIDIAQVVKIESLKRQLDIKFPNNERQ